MVRPVGADQHPEPLHPLDHERGLSGGGLEARAVAHEFDADVQTQPAHVADQPMTAHQLPPLVDDASAEARCVGREVVSLDDVEHRQPDGRRHGVSSEGVEVLHAVRERCRDLGRGDHRGQGMAVAGRLAHRDDVGNESLGGKPPELGTHSAEAHLHLVGDHQAAGASNHGGGISEVPVGEHHLSAAPDHRLDDHSGNPSARLVDAPADVCRIGTGRVARVAAVLSAVGVGHGSDVRPLGRASSAPARMLVVADVDERLRVPVVAVLDSDHVVGSGVRAHEPQREVVGLAAGVDEEAHRERLGQRCREPLGIPEHGLVQVARVGVQHSHLAGARPHHLGPRVAHVRDVVDRVEVAPRLVVVEGLGDSAHDAQRRVVRHAQARGQQPLTVSQRLAEGSLDHGHGARGKSQQQGGVGREPEPEVAQRRHAHAGVVVVEPEEVEDHLHVRVRRPPTVDLGAARPGEPLAGLDDLTLDEVVQRLAGEVSVQAVEGGAGRRLVAQHHHGPVVEG